jgi:hypothetical protein
VKSDRNSRCRPLSPVSHALHLRVVQLARHLIQSLQQLEITSDARESLPTTHNDCVLPILRQQRITVSENTLRAPYENTSEHARREHARSRLTTRNRDRPTHALASSCVAFCRWCLPTDRRWPRRRCASCDDRRHTRTQNSRLHNARFGEQANAERRRHNHVTLIEVGE